MNEPKARLTAYDDVVITGTGGDVVTPKVAQVGIGVVESTVTAMATPEATATVPQMSLSVDAQGRVCLLDAAGNVVQHLMTSLVAGPNVEVTATSTPTLALTTPPAVTTSVHEVETPLLPVLSTPTRDATTARCDDDTTPILHRANIFRESTAVRGDLTDQVRKQRPTVPRHPKPPTDYVLPRDHTSAQNYLTKGQAAQGDAWKMVWRDHERFEQLGSRDARVLVETAGCNHFFPISTKAGFTVSGACGHVSKGSDFHWLCRQCQFLKTREVCCTRVGNICTLGEVYKDSDKDSYEATRAFRHNFFIGIRDRGFNVKMEWLGDKPGLKYSVVARLSYAAAVGATGLEPNLRRFELGLKAITL